MNNPPAQLGFDDLLQSAEADNEARALNKRIGHLPATMQDALPYYRHLIERHHAAMIRADADEAMRLRKEARDLALRLNKGRPGVIAGDEAPGCVLVRETAAAPGRVPLWGQEGEFILTVDAMRVRIALEGMFGIGSRFGYWPGFSARAVDPERPFLSETGFRSFLGVHADPEPGLDPEAFCRVAIEAYVERELGGALRAVTGRHRNSIVHKVYRTIQN